jgi:hypothetical protein
MRSSELHTRMGLMLILLQEYSVIPELWEFFNTRPEDANDSDEFLRFLSTFGGFVLNVPDPEKMNRILKSIHVYHLIEGAEISGEEPERPPRSTTPPTKRSSASTVESRRRSRSTRTSWPGSRPPGSGSSRAVVPPPPRRKRSQEAADRAVKSQCQVDEND